MSAASWKIEFPPLFAAADHVLIAPPPAAPPCVDVDALARLSATDGGGDGGDGAVHDLEWSWD